MTKQCTQCPVDPVSEPWQLGAQHNKKKSHTHCWLRYRPHPVIYAIPCIDLCIHHWSWRIKLWNFLSHRSVRVQLVLFAVPLIHVADSGSTGHLCIVSSQFLLVLFSLRKWKFPFCLLSFLGSLVMADSVYWVQFHRRLKAETKRTYSFCHSKPKFISSFCHFKRSQGHGCFLSCPMSSVLALGLEIKMINLHTIINMIQPSYNCFLGSSQDPQCIVPIPGCF